MSLALALAPNGKLFVEDSEEASIPGSDAERIRRAFGEGNRPGFSISPPWSSDRIFRPACPSGGTSAGCI